jgi:DNA polymerase III subunit alpha
MGIFAVMSQKKCGCKNPTCKHTPFVHLHLHTSYSMLDGAAHIDDYVKLAKEYGHPAITILDHGNMSGTFEFYQKCKASGIKPVIGMEAYLNDELGKHEEQKFEGSDTHQSIIIKNQDGYKSLNKLTYKSFTEGYYRRGRITTEWLMENKNGLMITTSCMASKLSRLVEAGREVEAEERIKLLKSEFGDDLFAELQFNEVPEQKKYNHFILRMIKKYDLMPIVTGDVHYAFPEDNRLQDVLISINQRTSINDPDAFKLSARQLYYANAEDFHRMNREFGFNYPESFLDKCIENTVKVADRCTFEFETEVDKYPKYIPTKDVTEHFKTDDAKKIIKKLAHGKLNQKLKIYQKNNVVEISEEKVKQYRNRLDYELKVIGDKGMLDYFLVVWELIRFCKEKDIWTGPGRGSAAGSLLSWCLDITKIDPLRFDLYFERFLNPERKGTPDIDIDFEAGTDEQTMNFLLEKYGKERVVPVITFSTFNQKGCLKDVVKALGGDAGFSSEVFAVTKEMPWKPVWDITLEEWFETWPENPECSERVRNWLTDPANDEVKKLTLKLQGQVRNWGKHAAGIVITPGPVWESIPVNITKGVVVSAFQESSVSKDLSALGILKLDRLKLETLNVLKDAIKLVKKRKGIDIQEKVDYVDLNDSNLYEEIMIGNNRGIFQFESDGMNSLIKGIRVERFEELVAANALYRPGPMGIGAHEEYIKNKLRPDKTEYAHPLLRPILEKTNGVLIYQEQLMFIAKEIGGLSLGEGDNLRKYMDAAGKTISKQLIGEKLTEAEENNKSYKGYKDLWKKFISGAKKKGISEKDVQKIEEWLVKYLGYSFNLSHSLSYSYVAMQTLYLKRYYPTEFYTALLNHQKSTSDKDEEKAWLAATILAAMTKGIEITTPTRQSEWDWTMIEEGKIAMGLSSINGFGIAAYEEISQKKFCEMTKDAFYSTKFKAFNKTSFEACLRAGLFDDWSNSREEITQWRSIKIKDKAQIDIFGNVGIDSRTSGKTYKPTTDAQKYEELMQVCNLDLKLLNKIADLRKMFYEEYKVHIEPFTNFDDDKKFYYFCLNGVEERTSKRGTKFFSLTLSDGASSKKVNMWRDMYAKYKDVLQPGSFYLTKFLKDKGWLSFNASAPFRKVL